MKRESPHKKWNRLVGLARQASTQKVPDRELTPPPHLARRVAANWSTSSNRQVTTLDLFERVGLSGAVVAVIVCALVIIAGNQSIDSPETFAFDGILFAPVMEPGPNPSSPF